MREPAGELLHLARRARQFLFDEHLEVGADHLVAVFGRGLVVAAALRVLLDLPEDPRIRRRCAPDHHRIASRLRDDGGGIFRRADVTVADDRYLHRLLDGCDPLPARVAAVALLARPRMQRYRLQSALFSQLRQLYANDLLIVPPRAELHRERYLYRRARLLKDLPDARQVAQQSRAAVALDDTLSWAAQVQVHNVKAEFLDHFGRA